MPTLPTIVADTEFFSREVAVAVVWAATVGFTVWDVARFPFPVLVTLTVHLTRSRGARGTLPMARAVVRTGIDSAKHNSQAQGPCTHSNSVKF